MSETPETKPETKPETPDPGPDPVAYSRFSEVVGQRNEARNELAALKASGVELRAQHENETRKTDTRIEALVSAGRDSDAAGKVLERDLYLSRQHGISDPDISNFLSYKHGLTQPGEDGQRKPFTEWFAEYKATDPAVLRAAAGTVKAPPRLNGDTTEVPATQPTVDIGSLTREQYKAQRDTLLAANKIKVRAPSY